MRQLLQDPLAVAVGECGLDYNRNFSSKEDQLAAFSAQVKIAVDLKLPLFVHEREAHADLLMVLDRPEFKDYLPPVVIHCFTGTAEESKAYLDRGFFIGFTGTICKQERGRPLRQLLPTVPLDRIMLETDAPFMGFRKERRRCEPMDLVGVAQCLAEVKGLSMEEVCRTTTSTSLSFFGLTTAFAREQSS